MSETDNLGRDAGSIFDSAVRFGFEDAQLRKFRYHLVRLTVVGVTREEVAELGELGRLAFQESDVTKQVTAIKQRADVSALAFAIADIVGQAGNGHNLRSVMLGAVLGAYTSLGSVGENDQESAAVLGAIGGAVAMSTSIFIDANLKQRASAEYLSEQD